MMRFSISLPATRILAILVLALIFTFTLNVTCHCQPNLDPSTPVTQGEYTLIGVAAGDSNGQYQLLSSNSSAAFRHSIVGSPFGYALCIKAHNLDPITASTFGQSILAAGSNGEDVATSYNEVTLPTSSQDTASDDKYYVIFVSGCQPADVKWIDVLLTSSITRIARWRISGLTPTNRVILSDAPKVESEKIAGMTLQAHAARADVSSDQIWYTMDIPDANPADSYTFKPSSISLNWMPHGPSPSSGNYYELGFSPNALHGLSSNQGLISGSFNKENNQIHIVGTLVKHVVYSEPIAFHNITTVTLPVEVPPEPAAEHNTITFYNHILEGPKQTVTTANGVSITLVPFGEIPGSSHYFLMNMSSIDMPVLVSPKLDTTVPAEPARIYLPKLEYCQKTGKSVGLSFAFSDRTFVGPPEPMRVADSRETHAAKVVHALAPYNVIQFVRYLQSENAVNWSMNGANTAVKKITGDVLLTLQETGDVKSYPVDLTIPIASAPPSSNSTLINIAGQQVPRTIADFSENPILKCGKLDPSTASSQFSYKLLAVSQADGSGLDIYPDPSQFQSNDSVSLHGEPGCYGVWIGALVPITGGAASNQNPFFQVQNTVRAVDSNGNAVPVRVQPLYTSTLRVGLSTMNLCGVLLPGGQPPAVKWIDVLVPDLGGHVAKWRLTNLPKAYDLNSPPAPGSQMIELTKASVSSGSLLSRGGYAPGYDISRRYYDLTFTDKPLGVPSQYRLTIDHIRPEWSPLAPAESSTQKNPFLGWPEVTIINRGKTGGSNNLTIPVPYADYQRYARIDGHASEQFVTTETVTFNHLTLVHKLPTTNLVPLGPPVGNNIAQMTLNTISSTPDEYVVDGPEQTVTTPNGLTISVIPYDDTKQQGSGVGSVMYPYYYDRSTKLPTVKLMVKISNSEVAGRNGMLMLPTQDPHWGKTVGSTLEFAVNAPYQIEGSHVNLFTPVISNGYANFEVGFSGEGWNALDPKTNTITTLALVSDPFVLKVTETTSLAPTPFSITVPISHQ